ncbi:N-acetylmuramoyl-L-alanine amidase [Geodermatophilus sp. SYSU D01186]
MRRLFAGLTAFLAFSGTILVLPVYAESTPEAQPVTTSVAEVPLGSVEQPAPDAEVQEGTTDPVAGVPVAAPTLTVTRTGVAPFSLVGVTWAYDPEVRDVLVNVRVQDAAGAWGEWTEVGPEDVGADAGQDDGAAQDRRAGTAPLWTGPSTGVEVEVVARSGATPTDVQLDLVDPGSSPADASLGTPDIQDTAQAAMAMPDVYSRAQWGADEGIRSWDPEYAPTIKAATLHHTADTNNYTADQVPAMMRSIYRYHSVSLNWGDIGYNVIVDKFGRLWEGRAGGLASTVIGAHAGGFNTGTFGVSMLGNYDTVETPQPMIDAVAAIIAWKFALYGIDPRGTTVLTSKGGGTAKYAAGQSVTLPTIFGHRDVGSTACPGRYGYARLGEIRSAVAAQMPDRGADMAASYAAAGGAASLGNPVGSLQTANGVSWQAYDKGRVYWSPTTGATVVRNGPLLDKYLSWGGPAALGAPTADQAGTWNGTGSYVPFAGAGIYWSAATGAHVVKGATFDTWARSGWETGVLGFPTTDETTTRGGTYTHFQGGSIYWSPATGANLVKGAIYQAWAARGYELGELGFPTRNETNVPGGTYSLFQGGAIYWSPATGARMVKGAIYDAWARSGYEGGSLGFPTKDETNVRGGTYSLFQRGAIYWSPATGAHVVKGAIYEAWARNGYETGPLGFPTRDEANVRGGTYSLFQGGAIYWSSASGAHMVKGAIYEAWARNGYETGFLGFPTRDETNVRGGTYSLFQGGAVYWSPAGGAHFVKGAIYDRWAASGYETGPLGFPTKDETNTTGGTYSTFAGGGIYWSPNTGARAVTGAAYDLYLRLGSERGALGFPTTDAQPYSGGTRHDFQGGSIFVDARGTATVSAR